MEKSTEKNGRVGGRSASEMGAELKERGEQMLQQAQHAVSELSERLDLKGRVDANPIGMVAVALGIGYVLGGGLFTRFTGRLVRFGIRLAVLPAVKFALVDRAAELLRGALPEADAASPATSR